MDRIAVLNYTSRNIGDDIQARCFEYVLPVTDYITRCDKIKEELLPKEDTLFILSGWLDNTNHMFPLPENIKPLLFGVLLQQGYFNSASEELIEYLQKHDPIYARDLRTLKMLRRRKIKSRFIGCPSILIEPKGYTRGSSIVTVDVDHRKLPIDTDINISHILNPAERTDFRLRQERVPQLLEMYEKAALVITSRLHVALPCMALGTPVIVIFPRLFGSRLDIIRNFVPVYEKIEDVDDWNPKPINVDGQKYYIESLLRRVIHNLE
jgi:hypothetical protein